MSKQAAAVRLLALDVDGVLTDGRIYYTNEGDEIKAFNIKDGLGIKLLQRSGVQVAIITGRTSAIVERRARELGIDDIVQGREDKRDALEELCRRHDLALQECAYMGDDLPDLGAVRACGLGMTVADGAAPVREAAVIALRNITGQNFGFDPAMREAGCEGGRSNPGEGGGGKGALQQIVKWHDRSIAGSAANAHPGNSGMDDEGPVRTRERCPRDRDDRPR